MHSIASNVIEYGIWQEGIIGASRINDSISDAKMYDTSILLVEDSTSLGVLSHKNRAFHTNNLL